MKTSSTARAHRRAAVATYAAALTAALFGAPAPLTAAPAASTLKGHIPAVVARSRAVSGLDTSQPLFLALTLPLRHQTELTDLLHRLYDPGDPLYGQFLTPQEFTARFGPTQAEYDQAIAFARAAGLTVTGVHPNRAVLNVTGSAGQVERALGLRLQIYQSPEDGHYFYAPDAEPAVSDARAAVLSGVVGLDNAGVWKPHSRILSGGGADDMFSPFVLPRQTGSGPGGGLKPSDIRTAYGLGGVTLTGSGQSLAVFELANYNASDITAYENYFGLPNIPLQNVIVGSGITSNGADEVTLDIELQAALAPGASKIYVYEGPNSNAGVINTYNRIATDNLAKQISTSWGLAENSNSASVRNAENTAFQQMAAQGQSIFAASGDSGAYDNGSTLSVDDPASQPYMTGVGGTTLATNGGGGAYTSERTWNGGSINAGGGGGGISAVWTIPSYQTAVANNSPAASKVSKTMRNVPDVSLAADPNTGYSIYYSGNWYIFGGTSCASPLWAAFAALVNQQRVINGSGPIGFFNPPLYAIAATGSYGTDFHDIADGSTNLYYPAVTGYDDATGLGTFKGASLLADLAPSAATVVVGNGGFESPAVGAGGYQYGPSGTAWAFSGDAGVTGNGSPFTAANPAAPEGAQAAFIQTTGAVSQSVSGFQAGASYALTFAAAQRGNSPNGPQSLRVLVDGAAVGTVTPTGAAYADYAVTFAPGSGAHTITIAGTNAGGPDCTAFVDNVRVSLAPAPVAVGNGGFESPAVGAGGYQYGPSGTAWAFSGGAGVTGNGGPFTAANPAAPEGAQVGFLQGVAQASQSVSGFQAGASYALTFAAAQRGNSPGGAQTLRVLVDGAAVGTVTPTGAAYADYAVTFSPGPGAHTVAVAGVNGGDNTAFIDNVRVSLAPAPVAVGNGGFESPAVGAGGYQYGPSGTAWAFSGGAGVTGNGGPFTAANPAAPEGAQVGFLQGVAQASQSVSGFQAGASYALTFAAAQRGNSPGGAQTLRVLVDGAAVGTVTPTGAAYADYAVTFSPGPGAHTVAVAGVNGGDNTAFIDNVRVSLAPAPVAVGNGGFESPAVGAGGYQYGPSGTAWAFSGGAGVTGNGGPFTAANPAAPEGAQVGFLQGVAQASQSVSGFQAGASYALTFAAAQRGNSPGGAQTLRVLVDGAAVGTVTPTGAAYADYAVTFSPGPGAHTVAVAGVNGGDNTAFIDNVRISTR